MTGRIQTSLLNEEEEVEEDDDDEEEVEEDLWLGLAGKKKASGRMLSNSEDVGSGPVHGVPCTCVIMLRLLRTLYKVRKHVFCRGVVAYPVCYLVSAHKQWDRFC
jgi:hypothetical protein